MTGWLLFALAAPLLWAVSNLIDQHLLEHQLSEPSVLLALTGTFAAIPATIAILSTNLIWPGKTTALLAVVAGAVGCLVYLPYFHALKRASAVEVVLLWNLAPVFVIVLAHMLLHERLMVVEYVAIALFIASASIAAGSDGSSWRQTAPWMLAATFLLAVGSVIEKAVFARTPFLTGLAWISFGAVLVGVGSTVLRLIAGRRITSLSASSIGVVSGNQLLDVAAVAALSYAVSQGSVSIVKAVGGLQPLFVLIFATAAGMRRPSRWRSILAVCLAVIALSLVG